MYDALKKDIHVEVWTKGENWNVIAHEFLSYAFVRRLKPEQSLLNLWNTRFSCDPCKYFQWIHTPLFIDKRPLHKLKYATNLAEWKQQAEANVETWKQRNGWQTECKDVQQQTWLN